MKNFVEKGETILFVASGATASGSIVTIGDITAVSAGTYADTETGVANLCGVFALPKGAGAIAQGVKLYVAAGVVTTTASTNKFLGYAHLAAADTDTTVNVLLAR